MNEPGYEPSPGYGEMVVDPAGRRMKGMWLGFGRDFTINSGEWDLTWCESDTSKTVQRAYHGKREPLAQHGHDRGPGRKHTSFDATRDLGREFCATTDRQAVTAALRQDVARPELLTSGKIRRVELRARENELADSGTNAAQEYRDDQIPGLKG